MGYNIAIDGPSGAGKSTLSRAIAKEIGFIYVDTGALYRAVGFFAYQSKINADNKDAIAGMLSNIEIDLKFLHDEQRVFLNGKDVSDNIRMHIVSDFASKVGAVTQVRDFLLDMQRRLAEKYDVVMDGRDIGTVVLPHAQLKIYLTASAHDRAQRRYKELLEKGQSVSFDKILADVIERDKRDMSREIAPLKIADDAVVVDTTGKTFEQSLDLLTRLIKEHLK